MKLPQFWRRWLRSLVVLLALTFFCWARPTSVSAAVEYNEKIQFSDDFDSCSGERVLINGTQHIIGRFTRDAVGRLHFGFTRDTKGTGIGQLSGDKYILTDAVARASLEVAMGEVKTFTEQYHSVLIRQGEESSSDDTVVHFLSKITINANGDVTTSVEIQSVECR